MERAIVQSKKRGRPATGINPSIGVRLPPHLLTRLDRWRGNEPDLPARPEAIRRLIEAGLKSAPGTPSTGSGSGGSAKPASTGKTAPRPAKASPPKPRSAPATSSQPLTKAEQLRALREQGVR